MRMNVISDRMNMCVTNATVATINNNNNNSIQCFILTC
jgi:hypothetical protein